MQQILGGSVEIRGKERNKQEGETNTMGKQTKQGRREKKNKLEGKKRAGKMEKQWINKRGKKII